MAPIPWLPGGSLAATVASSFAATDKQIKVVPYFKGSDVGRMRDTAIIEWIRGAVTSDKAIDK
jgi:hypothetical protein